MNAREPLSPEEQALSNRLGEWSPGGPSAALDARILAQARGAVAAPAKRSQRRPWLVSLASAAALILTVGVVWRTIEAPRDAALIGAPEIPASDMPVMQEKQEIDRIEITGSRISGSEANVSGGEAPGDAGQTRPADPADAGMSADADAAATVGRSAARQPGSLTHPAEPATVPAAPAARTTPLSAPPAPPAPPPPPVPSMAPPPASAPASPPSEQGYSTPSAPPAPMRESVPNRDESSSRPPASDRSRTRLDDELERADVGIAPQEPPAIHDPTPNEPVAPQAQDREQRILNERATGPADGDSTPVAFESQVEAIRLLVAQKRLAEALRGITQLRLDYPRKSLPRDLRAIERRAGARR